MWKTLYYDKIKNWLAKVVKTPLTSLVFERHEKYNFDTKADNEEDDRDEGSSCSGHNEHLVESVQVEEGVHRSIMTICGMGVSMASDMVTMVVRSHGWLESLSVIVHWETPRSSLTRQYDI